MFSVSYPKDIFRSKKTPNGASLKKVPYGREFQRAPQEVTL